MPLAKVYRQDHMPSDLVASRQVFFQNNILVTPDNDAERRREAASLVQGLRKHLGLGKHQTILRAGIDSYIERDEHGARIPEAGALTMKVRVRERYGSVTTRDAIWVDDEHRPAGLSEENIAFAGGIALENEALGGGWYVDHRSNPKNVPYMTPRDEMLQRDLATVTPIRPGVEQEVPFAQRQDTGFGHEATA